MTPLIYTSKGNVPVDSLKYEHRWEETPDETRLLEFWYDAAGELVKNNVHILGKKSLDMGGQQARMG